MAVSGLTGSYHDELKLPSHVDRRIRGDMTQTHKFVNSIGDVDANKFFCFSPMQHGQATRQAASYIWYWSSTIPRSFLEVTAN